VPESFSGNGKATPKANTNCHIFTGWTPGVGAMFRAPRISSLFMGSFRYLNLNAHFTNYGLDEGVLDNSSFKLYYTTAKRQYVNDFFSAIRISISPELTVPANVKRRFLTAHCIVKVAQPVVLTSVGFHAHLLGREMYLHRISRDAEGHAHYNTTIWEERHWYFDDQYNRNLLSRNITLKSGDELQGTCVMDSTARETPTRFGLETMNEMCWVNAYFYPGGAGNVLECRGPKWTGTLEEGEMASEIPDKHPLSVDNMYNGWTDISDGSCDWGQETLLKECRALSRTDAWVQRRISTADSLPLVSDCCTKLQVSWRRPACLAPLCWLRCSHGDASGHSQ
jgi:hypothetical protein